MRKLDDLQVAWSEIGEGDRDGLNVALNEATWLGVSIDTETLRARLFLDVLSLPDQGPAERQNPVILTLDRVSRIAASLCNGWWNDTEAQVTPLVLGQLDATVHSFGGCPIYGWQFVDPAEESWAEWRHRLSVDARLAQDDAPHVIDLFQEGGAAQPRHFDLRIWFTRIKITTPDEREIQLDEFISARVRWWDGLYAADARASGKGIYPLRDE